MIVLDAEVVGDLVDECLGDLLTQLVLREAHFEVGIAEDIDDVREFAGVVRAALDSALDSAVSRPSILFTSASCASSSANLLRLLAFSIRSVSSENPSSDAGAVSVLAARAGPLADTRGGASAGARSGSTSPFATSLSSHSPQYNVDDVARLSCPLCTARSSLGRLDRLPVPFLAMCAHVVTLSSRSALASAAGSLVDVARSARVDAPGPSERDGVSRSASSSSWRLEAF